MLQPDAAILPDVPVETAAEDVALGRDQMTVALATISGQG